MSHPLPETFITHSWSSQAQWTVLDTGFASAQVFLRLWQCWLSHSRRPALLHYVALLSVQEAVTLPERLLQPAANERAADPDHPLALAQTLAAQCYALEAGFHRILLAQGQISLTLCVGEAGTLLGRQEMRADCLLAASPAQAWDRWQLKALARCCKRGTQLQFCGPVLPDAQLLEEVGMLVDGQGAADEPTERTEPAQARKGLRATFNPRWQLRAREQGQAVDGSGARDGSVGGGVGEARSAGRCAVVGAGIAGASVARALALRGWQVDVYDAHPCAAAGASGLPVGLVVPHHSADDSPRSRLSRHGTRLMLAHAAQQLQTGQDWNPSGVLELSIAPTGLGDEEAELLAPPQSQADATGWAQPMAYGDAHGLWHPHAAWIKPAQLVAGWLQHPQIQFHGGATVHTLERNGPQWLLRDAKGLELGRADTVVFANAFGCVDLLTRLASALQAGQPAFAWLDDVLEKVHALHTMHGTLSHGPCPAPTSTQSADATPALPAFPVNGHGSLVAGVPSAQGPQWYAGSTFQSDLQQHANLEQEQAANFQKLQGLLPAAAQALAPQFASGLAQTWQGSRCITHDRLPLVGPLDAGPKPSLWLCAGMGARGLSFSALCAELLAAWLGGEPLPVENNLARSLSTRRLRRKRSRAAGGTL